VGLRPALDQGSPEACPTAPKRVQIHQDLPSAFAKAAARLGRTAGV